MASILYRTKHLAAVNLYRGLDKVVGCFTPGFSIGNKNVNAVKGWVRRYCANKTEITKKPESSTGTVRTEHSAGVGIADKFHHPSQGEKKLMVWTKIYPNMESIPKTVSHQQVLKAKDIMRVYITYSMVVIAALVAAGVLLVSRQAREKGDSLTKRKLEWKKALEEQGRKEREAAARKAQEGKTE